MNFKQTALTTAVAATLAMGVCGQANAFVYAGSGLSVDNLAITIGGATTTVTRFDFNLTNTATLNGVSAIQTATCGGTIASNNCSAAAPALDAQPANAPGGTVNRTNNQTTGGEFTFIGPLSGFAGTFSNSDSVINTAELVQLGQPTSTHNIAEALLNTGTSASSSSQIQSITGLTFVFTVGGPATLDLSFLADPDLEAFINNELTGTHNAQANINASFTLSQNTGGNGFVNWNPQGTTLVNDCSASGGPTCAETADTQDLNVNVGTTVNGTFDRSSWDPNVLTETAFGIHIANLSAGTYTLTLNEVKSVQLARTVPEPGTLALMGIGMMGLFASMRRKMRG